MRGEEPVASVVDDDRAIQPVTGSLVSSDGFRVKTFRAAQEFLRAERPGSPARLVLDVRLPGSSGRLGGPARQD